MQASKEDEKEIVKKISDEKSRQSELMREKLAKRKRSRQQSIEEHGLTATASAEKISTDSQLLMPQREKSVILNKFSDSMAEKEFARLKRDIASKAEALEREKTRQEEHFRKRLRRQRRKSQSEAQEVMLRGEEQRIQLERNLQEERERQRKQTRDQLERARTEKSHIRDPIQPSSATSTIPKSAEEMELLSKLLDEKYKIALSNQVIINL